MSGLAAFSPSTMPLDLGVMVSRLDAPLGSRATIGLVVLATDQTLEHEYRSLIRAPGIAF